MNIAIVDDVPEVLEQILNAVKSIMSQDDHSFYPFSKATDFIKAIDEISFDAAFLDIDMPDINGFQLSERIKDSEKNILIIYVTGHENLVIQSFRYKPIGFVRKAHLKDELPFAVSTLLSEFNKDGSFVQIRETRSNGGTVHQLPISKICTLESMKQKHLVEFTLKDSRKITTRGTLTEFSEMSEFNKFILINSGILANMELFDIVNDSAVFPNGQIIKISRRKKELVIQEQQKIKRRLLI